MFQVVSCRSAMAVDEREKDNKCEEISKVVQWRAKTVHKLDKRVEILEGRSQYSIGPAGSPKLGLAML